MYYTPSSKFLAFLCLKSRWYLYARPTNCWCYDFMYIPHTNFKIIHSNNIIELLAKLDMIKIIGMSYLIFCWWRKILSLGLGILVDEVCHVKGIVWIPWNYIHIFFLVFQITFHDVVNQTKTMFIKRRVIWRFFFTHK